MSGGWYNKITNSLSINYDVRLQYDGRLAINVGRVGLGHDFAFGDLVAGVERRGLVACGAQ